jgi:hypothetical protein
MPLTKRQIRNRIRHYVAAEIRGRIRDSGAGYLEDEPREVIEAWDDEVCSIADRIYSEDRE